MNVDYRIFVLTREGQILTIKNGELSGRVLPCDGVPVSMVCAGAKEIYIALSNRVFEVRTMKGRKVCSVHLDSDILDMQLFQKQNMSSNAERAVILALANGEVRIYKLDRLLYKSNSSSENSEESCDNIMALRCGRYGRSSVCLTSVRRSGTIRVKIFRRQAKLNFQNNNTTGSSKKKNAPPPPLSLPKKTKVYVEQVQRERDQASDMHHTFQRDLAALRMKSAQSYVKLIKIHGPSMATSESDSPDSEHSVRLDAEIRGLGPQFHLLVHVISNASTTTLRNVLLTFSFDHDLYHMPRSSIRIPVLIPGITYKYKFVVRSIDRNGAAGKIGIHLYPSEMALPFISADVAMPLSEVFFQEEEE